MSRNPVRSSCAQPHQCSLDVRLRAMRMSPLLGKLTPQQHLELDEKLSAWSWADDDPILLAGEESDGSYLIVAGRVRVTRDTVDGKEITVDVASPGDVIGPLHTRTAEALDSAWAMETTCALYLPARALGDVVTDYPAFAVSLLQMQQERLAASRTREVDQATKTVEQRVAAVLLDLDERMGQVRSDGSHLIQARVRRDDIAGMAGTTIESASRAMTRLRKRGLIDAGREWVTISDVDGLRAVAEGC